MCKAFDLGGYFGEFCLKCLSHETDFSLIKLMSENIIFGLK